MSLSRDVASRAILIAVLLFVIGLPAAPFSATPVIAQQPRKLPWEHLSVPGPVYRLFAPPSGALFAQTKDGLLRSMDAGASWESIPLPEREIRSGLLAVHPTEPQTIYSRSDEGLAKTTDGGA